MCNCIVKVSMPSVKLLLSGAWALLINTPSAGSWVCSCSSSSRLCPGWGKMAGAPGKERGIKADPLPKGHGHLEHWPGRGCQSPRDSAGASEQQKTPDTKSLLEQTVQTGVIKVWGCLYWGSLPGGTSSSYYLVCCSSWLNELKEPGVWDSAVVGKLELSQ